MVMSVAFQLKAQLHGSGSAQLRNEDALDKSLRTMYNMHVIIMRARCDL